jgi:glycosyltransferase involved in cell wall biosynthesis
MQVLPALETGGVERSAVDVAGALVQAGWVAIVVSRGGQMVREVERAGALHVTLPVHSKNPFVMRRNVDALVRLARQHNVDIIHARSRAPAWSGRAAATRLGIKFVTTVHGAYSAGNPLKRYYNGIMARGDRVIANSHFTAAEVQRDYRVDPPRLVAIPRGVDVSRIDPAAVTQERMVRLTQAWALPDGVPVVMLPGRLTRWKGQHVLIDAVAKLAERHGRDSLVCLLVGDDQGRTAYSEELARAIAQRGIAGTVRLVGHCRDMAAAYMLADVVVSASTDPEAFGRIAVEAQAMGRPVIATDHGGARETILPGETGWLVPPGNAAALADALEVALSLDAGQRATLAAAARANVLDKYTVEHMCAATLNVYAEVLGL